MKKRKTSFFKKKYCFNTVLNIYETLLKKFQKKCVKNISLLKVMQKNLKKSTISRIET